MCRTRLGTDLVNGQPVFLDDEARALGTYIIGRTGTGKTTLIENLAVHDMEAGLGMCVLDPHGDLVNRLLARTPNGRRQDVVLLDPRDSAFPFGLNPYWCADPTDRELVGRIGAQNVELFQKLWGEISWGPRLAQFMRNSAFTLLANPGLTMAEIPALLTDAEFRARAIQNVTNQQVLTFWDNYGRLRPHEQQEHADSTLNKLDEFLTQPIVANIVGQSRITADFRSFMDEGKIVLVPLGLGRLGEPVVNLLGSLIVLQILNAALARENMPPSQRRQFNLYADEYQRFATPAFTTLLTEARKYGVATTLAHQVRAQLDEEGREAALNAANIIVFAVTGEDGQDLARQFDRTPPEAPVTGRQPTLTICQDPVSQLTRTGHQDEKVRRIASSVLAPLVASGSSAPEGQLWQHCPDEGWRRYFDDEGAYYASRATLQRGWQLLNTYLVDMMEGRLAKADMAARLYSLLFPMRGYFGIAPLEQPLFVGSMKIYQHGRDNGVVEVPWISECGEPELRNLVASIVEKDLVSREETAAFGVARRVFWTAFLEGPWKSDPDLVRQLAARRAAYEAMRAREMTRDLLYLGAVLALDPILVDSGQWAPTYDRPRTYGDVEGEVASRLVNQPRFQATCRLTRAGRPEEYQIQMTDFVLLDEAHSFTRAEVVRARSRRLYARPRAEVEAEMRARRTLTAAAPPTTRAVRQQ